jgi:FkbM family methyltransferase
MNFRELVFWLLKIAGRGRFMNDSALAITKLFALAVLFPNKREVQVRIFGFRVEGPSYYSILFLVKEIFLEQQYRFETTEPAPLIFDCGSNIGMTMLYFKLLYPQARVVCFEPQQRAFSFLQRNVELNRLNKVETHRVALGDRNGYVDFFEPNTGAGLMASLFASRESRGHAVSTPMHRLSEHLQTTPDLIKLDVEGAETLVIQDLLLSGKMQAKQVFVEFHHGIDGMPSSLGSFLEAFERNGYSYNMRASYSQHGDYQDICLHFKKTIV